MTNVPIATLLAFTHDLSEQRIGLVRRLTFGGQVVGGAEVDGIDVVEIYEVGDLDEPRLLRLGGNQVLVAEDDVLTAAEVDALDDVPGVSLPCRSAR